MSQYDAYIMVKLPQSLKDKGNRQAERQGLSLSAHIRRMIAVFDDPDVEYVPGPRMREAKREPA